MTTEVEQQLETLSPANDATGRLNFDLLAHYLEPKFGNIYGYNLNGGDPGFEVQEWTEEIRDAIRGYLLHELPDDVATVLFEADVLQDIETKQEAVTSLIASHEPWEVADEVRAAAVIAVPKLDQIIGNLTTWPSEDERWDTFTWLDRNVSEPVLGEMAFSLGWRGNDFPFGVLSYLTDVQEPPALLKAWHHVVGPAPSDLTDDEWCLLAQVIPPGGTYGIKTEQGAASTRQALNGMLYRHYKQTTWIQLPRRYGTYGSIYPRYIKYKKSRVFARMLAVLDDTPGTERLVEWLHHVEGAKPSKVRSSGDESSAM